MVWAGDIAGYAQALRERLQQLCDGEMSDEIHLTSHERTLVDGWVQRLKDIGDRKQFSTEEVFAFDNLAAEIDEFINTP
jgi:hypothetical protein